MPNKKNFRKQIDSVGGTKRKSKRHKLHTQASVKNNMTIPAWMIPAIILVTAVAFIPTLSAGFVNLDDGDYVTNNVLIKSGSLKQLLITPVQGNYHPLTMLSLYINYTISGDHAWSYHLFNLLFHLVNCILVFRLVILLSNRNAIMAFTASLLFGIHPMHVESVAWISERKDVLYGLFFLAGLISYTKYADTGSKRQYLLTILFLILSLLSKPAAVIFPAALFCIDLLRKRTWSFKLFMEKVPFFILASALGIIVMLEQKAAGATGNETFSTSTKILFGFYAIMMYFIKMIAPFKLAVFYPFPPINQSLPIAYYLSPLFFLILAITFFYSLKRNRVVAFSILFYLANLLLILQLLPVGSAVIAERYTYIPYLGLFFSIGWLIARSTMANGSKAYAIIFLITLFFFVLTWVQASVWHDSDTLWDQAIKTQPSNKAYSNRASLLRSEKKYELALDYFNKAIQLSVIDYESYNNRGNIYFDLKKSDLALNDYRKAISLKPDYYNAMDNMGAQFAILGQYDSALKYESQALLLNPDHKPAYSNRALIYMKLNENEKAIKDWTKYLQFDPNAADVYNIIGSCYQAMRKYKEALISTNKAISLNPDPVFYLNRAYSYYGLKDFVSAKRDAMFAKQHGIQIPGDFAKVVGMQ